MKNQQPQCAPNDRFSIKEAAQELGVHPNTVYRFIKEGKIKVSIRKINGFRFVTGAEILRVWNSQY